MVSGWFEWLESTDPWKRVNVEVGVVDVSAETSTESAEVLSVWDLEGEWVATGATEFPGSTSGGSDTEVIVDITGSSEDFSDEFVIFELNDAGLGTMDFLAEVFRASNGLVVAIDVVDGLETNDVLWGVNNDKFLYLVRGTRVLGEEGFIVEEDGVRMALAVEIVFSAAPHI